MLVEILRLILALLTVLLMGGCATPPSPSPVATPVATPATPAGKWLTIDEGMGRDKPAILWRHDPPGGWIEADPGQRVELLVREGEHGENVLVRLADGTLAWGLPHQFRELE